MKEAEDVIKNTRVGTPLKCAWKPQTCDAYFFPFIKHSHSLKKSHVIKNTHSTDSLASADMVDWAIKANSLSLNTNNNNKSISKIQNLLCKDNSLKAVSSLQSVCVCGGMGGGNNILDVVA